MQQALYNNTVSISNPAQTADVTPAGTATRGAGMVRWIVRRWDLVGVLALMGSSAAYGVFALAHLV